MIPEHRSVRKSAKKARVVTVSHDDAVKWCGAWRDILLSQTHGNAPANSLSTSLLHSTSSTSQPPSLAINFYEDTSYNVSKRRKVARKEGAGRMTMQMQSFQANDGVTLKYLDTRMGTRATEQEGEVGEKPLLVLVRHVSYNDACVYDFPFHIEFSKFFCFPSSRAPPCLVACMPLKMCYRHLFSITFLYFLQDLDLLVFDVSPTSFLSLCVFSTLFLSGLKGN